MDEHIQHEIRKIIREIEEKSADGDYIYRGEPETFEKEPYCGKVSSSLWREIAEELLKQGIDIPIINTKFVQTEMLSTVQNYSNETAGEGEFEIMGQLQHYGGKTNLIDFTTDYLRALFFACNGSPSKNGRIVLLQRNEDIDKKYNVKKPDNPINRVIAQKSVFVQPLGGFIDPQDICGRVLTIPKDLKQWILQHLRKYHDISTETIYNDLHGFIKNQNLHQRSYIDFFIGLSHQFRRDDDLAINGFDRAIELNPSLVEAYNNRAVAYQRQGDLNRAITDFDKAIDLKPNYATAYNNRGSAYHNQGDLNRAIADFTKAIDLKADYFTAYNNRGAVYHNQRDLDYAITDFDKAIELKPNYAEAYLNRGNVHRDYGNLDHAIADYTKAINLKPNYAMAYNNRGDVYRYQGDFEHALTDFDKAIDLEADHNLAYNNRGITHGAMGDYTRAIEDLDKAIELKPNYVGAYLNRGNVYWDYGDLERAIADFDCAIELNPNYTKAHNNRNAVQRELERLNESL